MEGEAQLSNAHRSIGRCGAFNIPCVDFFIPELFADGDGCWHISIPFKAVLDTAAWSNPKLVAWFAPFSAIARSLN
jgi:hypothetical protein